MESWTCIARKSRRVARDSDATRDVKEEKKGKVQRADTATPWQTQSLVMGSSSAFTVFSRSWEISAGARRHKTSEQAHVRVGCPHLRSDEQSSQREALDQCSSVFCNVFEGRRARGGQFLAPSTTVRCPPFSIPMNRSPLFC